METLEEFFTINPTSNDPSSMFQATTMANNYVNQDDGGGVLKIDTSTGKAFVQEFEIYKLVKENDPILKQEARAFDFSAYDKNKNKFTDHENPYYLSQSLFQTMFKYDGLGLAAPQCGIPYAVFVMGTSDMKQVMFNPVILQQSIEKEIDIEGCISYPGLLIKVPRSKAIRVQWQHIDGSERVQDFVGLTARVIQHEIDHLRAKLFFKSAGKTSLIMARNKRAKLLKKLERSK